MSWSGTADRKTDLNSHFQPAFHFSGFLNFPLVFVHHFMWFNWNSEKRKENEPWTWRNVQGQMKREISCRRGAWRKQCCKSSLSKMLGMAKWRIGKIRLTEKECMTGEMRFIGLEKSSSRTASGRILQRKCLCSLELNTWLNEH